VTFNHQKCGLKAGFQKVKEPTLFVWIVWPGSTSTARHAQVVRPARAAAASLAAWRLKATLTVFFFARGFGAFSASAAPTSAAPTSAPTSKALAALAAATMRPVIGHLQYLKIILKHYQD
jgi:hypothetical protein